MISSGYITGKVSISGATIPAVSPVLTAYDMMDTILVRWNIGRMNYKVQPGLYAIGSPDSSSDVFVTCNFKLTFDQVRKALEGMNAWILVLDTRGINVWCAAGKGTFGTKELVNRIKKTGLESIVSHRRLILPQLGATGVSAHEVKSQSGFRVIYGPVRAEDIAAFMKNGMKATDEMRRVRFRLADRIKLIPVELSYGKYWVFIVPAVFFLLSGINPHGYSIDLAISGGLRALLILLVSYLAGLVMTPILLPWIPFRRFSLKGLVCGWSATLILFFFGFTGNNVLEIISWFLISGGLASFLGMNWTGSSTFTSLSGVQKEMKTALPMQIIMAAAGLVLFILSKIISI
jgi:acetyl-CoA decarbonylase/synthase complex subunit gamma